jgi:hypothetical protein
MNIKIKRIIRIQRCLVGLCKHNVTVRKIDNGWNCRVFLNGIVNQELKVFNKEHIRLAIAEMLRWEDKCGNISDMASASRERNYREILK